MRLTDLAHNWLKQNIQSGDIVVDATLGNGHDALFLANCIGSKGKIFGFDVQQQAIDESQLRLLDCGCEKAFFLLGHQHLNTTLPPELKGKVKAFTFNLGWLPGGDKNITTQVTTTIDALSQALTWLSTNGIISLVLYPGHTEGAQEKEEILSWLAHTQTTKNMSPAFVYQKIEVPDRPLAPVLVQLQKQ